MSPYPQNNEVAILIVESDPVELDKLHHGFSIEGFSVESLSDSESVVERLQQRPFQVAVIDLMLPGINGLQLARLIRESHPHIITVLMSSYHLSPIQLAKANIGVSGFVPKPFKINALVDFIKKKLSDAAGQVSSNSVGKRGLGVPIDISKAS